MTDETLDSRTRTWPGLVSVVIPARNEAANLPAQLDALSRQTYEGDWELVVVDNGSTDGTAEVALNWIGKVPGLRVIQAPEHRGCGHPRNAGTKAAKGQFIAYCDADDICHVDWLRAMVDAGMSCDVVAGALDFATINEASVVLDGHVKPLDRKNGFLPTGSGSNCGLWADVLQRLGGWGLSEYGGEDKEFFWRAQLGSYTVGAAPEALVYRREVADLWTLMRKGYRRGISHPELYRRFRSEGMPRIRARRVIRSWGFILLTWPRAVFSRRHRRHWIHQAAMHTGRVLGSVRFRVLYP